MPKLTSQSKRAKANQMNPTEATSKTIPIQKTLFDLDTMSEVTLFKEVEFTPVTTTEEALKRLGHDAKKFLAVINDGLETETARAARSDSSIPWLSENDEGEKVAFAGTPADSKAVNGLVLNLAKSVFGYTKESEPEAKRAAKQSAIDMITSNEAIREGLKKNAAA
jgi:hypothetical protein